MTHQLSLLALAITFSAGSAAMQVLDDSLMQDISGQGGITIESTTTDPLGYTTQTGEIRYTQKNNEGGLDSYLSIGSLKQRYYTSDANGNFIGLNTIKTLIDVDTNGNLSIKTLDVDTMDIHLGEITLSGRTVLKGMEINVWEYAAGSYTELFLENAASGARIHSRTIMKDGSGYSQLRHENDISISNDVVYKPAAGQDAYTSELILTSSGNGLKLEFGETHGTMEIQNFTILDKDSKQNIFGYDGQGKANTFGDLGYGNIQVNSGYMTIRANDDPTKNGLEGEFASDLTVGNAFYRTDNAQLNAKNVSFKTVGEVGYSLAMMNNGFATGLEMQIHSANTTAELVIGALTLSDENGSNETASAGSFAITGFGLNGGTAEVSLYTLPGHGSDGLRQVINATGKTSYNLEIYDEGSVGQANAPKLSAEIVMNNITQDQTTTYSHKGIRTITASNSMDVNVNALKVGNNVNYQGQSGRIIMNNYHQTSGSYTQIEPLR